MQERKHYLFRVARIAFVILLPLLIGQILFSALERREFALAAAPGFGDRQNSWAWSMQWWRGDLYVGTNRAYSCVSAWELQKLTGSPIFPYPPNDPDIQCTPNPADLPMQAEIWRWSPITQLWTRVYQSPNDVPNPDQPGKFLPRDNGYRTMAVFTDSRGVESLYIGGINTQPMWNGKVPPPRILRTTDGATFTPLPQTPGTFLGDLADGSIRSLLTYKGKLFAISGSVQGAGRIIASSTPELGDNAWSFVAGADIQAFELELFNGWLYAGVQDAVAGYDILKTLAEGPAPYSFQTVVSSGGYLPEPSSSILSMQVFNGRLIAGSAALAIPKPPVEILRIDADDHWDLLVGTPRQTPTGMKYPLSGLGDGFENGFNDHIWRMQSHESDLYIGTYDSSRDWKSLPGVGAAVRGLLGFDMYRTADGWYYHPLSTIGFGDRFSFGVRNFASTPFGLFVGSANPSFGLRIWRGLHQNPPPLAPPKRLEAEPTASQVLLSWEPVPLALQYHIYKIPLNTLTILPSVLGNPTIPDTPVLVTSTTATSFADAAPTGGARQLYYVIAEGIGGTLSESSNFVRAPLLTPLMSFSSLTFIADKLNQRNLFVTVEAYTQTQQAIQSAAQLAIQGDFPGSLAALSALRTLVESGQIVQPTYSGDLAIPLRKLERRVSLTIGGSIKRQELLSGGH